MHSALPILYQEIALCKYLFPQMSNKSVCKWRRGLHGEGEEGERMSDTLRTATIHQVKHTNKSLYKYTFVGSCKAVLAYHDLHPSLRSHSKRPPRPLNTALRRLQQRQEAMEQRPQRGGKRGMVTIHQFPQRQPHRIQMDSSRLAHHVRISFPTAPNTAG